MISGPVFAFYLADGSEYSYFDLGAIDETAMLDSEQLVTQSTSTADSWSQTLQGIRFGLLDEFSVDKAKAIIDSTTSCIVIPSKYYLWVLQKLFDDYGMSFTSFNGENVFLDSCLLTFDLPSLYFLVGGYWYQADPADWIVISDDRCFVCLQQGEDDWVLGTALMKGYYSTFDLDSL